MLGASVWRLCFMALAAVVLVAGACGGDGADPDTIEGTWLFEAVSIDGDPYAIPEVVSSRDRGPHAVAWVTFGPDGRVEGGGPCNRYGGTFEFDGRDLELEAFPSLVACIEHEDAVMTTEAIVFSVLGEHSSIRFSGSDSDVMEWSAEGTTVTFRRAEAG